MKKSSIKKIYLMLGTIAGLIGTLVSLGVVLYSFFSLQFISDEEYLYGYSAREIEQCGQPTSKWIESEEREEITPETEEETAECKTKATERVINKRHYEFKNTTIGSITRGTLFLVVLLIHGIPFSRSRDED
jgi:hypothetical protein